MKLYLGAAAIAVTAALVVPALASGHGSVYQSTANTGAGLTPETRYFITNHGYSYVLRETNNLRDSSPGADAKKGMVAYNLAPSAWRTGKSFSDVMNVAGTGAQPHATCLGAATLESEAAIRSWQGTDAFYNYVPFQTASAGLEDDPAKWLATLAGAGVTTADLATEQSRTTKCTALGGTYTRGRHDRHQRGGARRGHDQAARRAGQDHDRGQQHPDDAGRDPDHGAQRR